MIIPRFTLRWLLALLTVCGLLSFVLAYAVRGESWAIGAVVGLCALGLMVALHAAAFSCAWLLTQFTSSVSGGRGAKTAGGQSPFASSPFASVQPADPEPPAIMS
jgi:hypothetical protein